MSKRKIILILLAALFFLVGGVMLLIPYLLRQEAVQDEIAHQLSSRLGSEITVDRLQWRWLPMPHLMAREMTVEYPHLRIRMPEIHVYPSWLALFGLSSTPARILLRQPHITIDPDALAALDRPPAADADAGPEPAEADISHAPMLGGEVEIRNGLLELTGAAVFSQGALQAGKLSEVNGRVRVASQRLAFEFGGRPSFGEKVSLGGWYDWRSAAYQFKIDGRGLRLHEALTALSAGRINLEESVINLHLEAESRGDDDLRLAIRGDLPCLLWDQRAKEIRFDCGGLDLALERQGENFRLRINDFELKEPGLRLAGNVSRQRRPDEAEPRWEIDLNGRDLNLTAIRATLLDLFGEDETAQEVTAIVRGGFADQAGFRFAGTAAELADLANLEITAEAREADIWVPDIDLALNGVYGSLTIKDGILRINGAGGRWHDSIGKDGTLTIGLLEATNELEIDLALDSAMPDILRVLAEIPALAEERTLQAELARFRDPQGRAVGRLRVGDSFLDYRVAVEVQESSASASFDRLPWRLAPDRGEVVVHPDWVEWRGVRGTVGPHLLERSSGRINLDQEAAFEVQELAARIEGNALFAHLQGYPAVAALIAPALSKIEGRLTVWESTAAGPLYEPEQWRYALKATAENLTWHSPLLGESVVSRTGVLELSEQAAVLRDLQGRMAGSSMVISGELRHLHLHDWQGSLQLTGELAAASESWLRQREILPAILAPRLPLALAPLKLTWDNEKMTVSGLLRAGSGKERAELRLNAKTGHDNPLALQLAFNDQGRRAEMELDLLDRVPETVSFSWQGELSGGTLGRFLADPAFQQGEIRGNYRLLIPAPPQPAVMAGHLEARNLRWPQAENELELLELRLAGAEGKSVVQALELSLGGKEHLRLQGEVKALPRGLQVEMELTSRRLSRRTLLALADDLASWRDSLADPAATAGKSAAWPITGRVRFNLAEFVSGPAPSKTAAAAPAPLIWRPLAGTLTLHPGGKMAAEISKGELCCLGITGVWFSDPSLGDSRFKIATTCPEPPRFETLLPCLGISQDLIEGTCLINADLKGDLKFWRDGRLTVTSPEGGRILRLKLLAKIFSLVNVTDLFSGGVFSGFEERGFPYKSLEFEAGIKDNILVIEKAVIRGEGLNLFARGSLNLGTLQSDLVVMIAPFKTIDAVVAKIPLVGRIFGGKDAAVVTIPVAVKGDIRDPETTVMSPEAVGEGLLNLVRNTLLLPFHILSPILPDKKE